MTRLRRNQSHQTSSAQTYHPLRRTDNRRTIQTFYEEGATRRTVSDYASSCTLSSNMNRRSSAPVSTRSEVEKAERNSLPCMQIALPSETLATATAISPFRRNRNSSTLDGTETSKSASSPQSLDINRLVLPLRLPPTAVGPSQGHKRSVSYIPQPVTLSPTQTRRWQSDVSGVTASSRLSRSSGSRRERIRSIIRQFRRPSWSAVPAQCPARSRTERRAYEGNMGTSNDLASADGSTAPLLVQSAQTGSRADVAQLLENGHEIESRHISTRRTALLVASQHGNEEVVELLLHRNARVDVTDKSGSTALHLASSRGHCGVMELLLPECFDIDARNFNGQTALWLAAYYGHVDATRLLIACHAKLNARADNQTTALHAAAKQGDSAIVHLLVSEGADVEAKDGMMMTALHYACEAGHLRVIEILLDNKANIDAMGNDHRTPLICAAATGQLFATQWLLKRKASTRCVDDASMTALHWAAFNGHSEVVDVLSPKRSVLSKTNVAGRTVLHLAAMNGQFAVVEHLVRKSIHLETRCNSGFTPLHYACLANSLDVTRLLLISGADIEACANPDLRRSIHIAAADGSMGLLNLLCDKGASLEARDSAGDRALCVACRYGHAAAVQNLLDRGSPVYLPYEEMSEEDSPLCLAAMGGHLSVVTLLLQRGALAIKRDERGWPPYRHAAYYGHPDVLRLLLSCSLEAAKEDANIGLTVDRIGFAPSLNISERTKIEVQNLLYQMQQSSLSRFGIVPGWTSYFPADKNDQYSRRTALGSWSDSPMDTHLTSTTTVIPQELPGTLEQGLPPSRSHTPEHMRREASPSHAMPGLRSMPRAFLAKEHTLGLGVERSCPKSSARSHIDSFEKPRGISSPLEITFDRTQALAFSPESPNSIIEARTAKYPLDSIWISSTAYQNELEEDEDWDSESSLSSVYTALEGEAFELAV